MKVTFYKSVLKECGLTPTDKIVLCQILYLSLMESHGISFNSDGEFVIDDIIKEYGGHFPIKWNVSEKYISHVLNISLKQSYLSFNNLKDRGYIITNKFNEKLVRMIDLIPYFELKIDSGLKGNELIVYSYLSEKSKLYGWVDKYHNALAEDLNLSYQGIKMILHKLYNKGFLERMRKGHQVLLRVCSTSTKK